MGAIGLGWKGGRGGGGEDGDSSISKYFSVLLSYTTQTKLSSDVLFLMFLLKRSSFLAMSSFLGWGIVIFCVSGWGWGKDSQMCKSPPPRGGRGRRG